MRTFLRDTLTIIIIAAVIVAGQRAIAPKIVVDGPSMSIQTLTKTIKHLPPRDRRRLFDHLRPNLEDYLLVKIVEDRFKKNADRKRIAWEELKP